MCSRSLSARICSTDSLRLPAKNSETCFFLKEVDAQITFERDVGGAATGLVLHQNVREMWGRG